MLRLTKNAKDISAHYKISLIPCGVEDSPGESYENWTCYVVLMPVVSTPDKWVEQSSLSFDDLNQGEFLTDLIKCHPLLCEDANFNLYLGSVEITAELVGIYDVEGLNDILNAVLQNTGVFHKLAADESDMVSVEDKEITEKNIVDIVSIYNNYCKTKPNSGSFRSLMRGDSSANNSWHTMKRELSMENIRSVTPAKVDDCSNKALTDDQRSIAKYRWLVENVVPDEPEQTPAGVLLADGESCEIDELSVESIIFSILQNFELAKELGLVCELKLTVNSNALNELDTDEGDLSIQFTGDSTAAMDRIRFTTKVRRSYLNDSVFFVQPASRYKSGLNLLTPLGEHSKQARATNSVVSYSAVPFSIDQSIIHNVLLPQNDDSSNDDDPLPNPEEERIRITSLFDSPVSNDGVHPFTGRGLTFIAPVQDLKAPAVKPAATSTTQYLEDFWDGYRLDVAFDDKEDGDGLPEYRSIHTQSRTFTVQHPAGGKLSRSVPITEDVVYREQRTSFKKPEGVCQSDLENIGEPIVHPALLTWDGLGTVQTVPWSYSSDDPYASEQWQLDYVRDKDRKVIQGMYTALLYKRRYSLRSRISLEAGIGLTAKEADKAFEALASPTAKLPNGISKFTLPYRHTRNRPFSPGILAFPEELQKTNEDPGVDLKLQIGRISDQLSFYLYPTPLERDEIRYHGLVPKALKSKRGRHLGCLEGNLSDFLKNKKHGKHDRVSYFADPDVAAVGVNTWILGNPGLDTKPNPAAERSLKDSDAVIRCTDVNPYVVGDEVIKLDFGKGDSFGFKPIQFVFKTTNSEFPSVETIKRSNGVNCLVISVPPGDRSRIEIRPWISFEKCEGSTAVQELMPDLISLVHNNSVDRKSVVAQLSKTPGVCEAIAVEVSHVVSKPLKFPTFERIVTKGGDNLQQTNVQVYRSPAESQVSLSTAVEVDARTTGSVALELVWPQYVDDTRLPGPAVIQTPSLITPKKNVYFGVASTLESTLRSNCEPGDKVSAQKRLSELASRELYCVERSILFGSSPQENCEPVDFRYKGRRLDRKKLDTETPAYDVQDSSGALDMGDLRHYRATVTCVGFSRFENELSDQSEISVRSTGEVIDVPSGMIPPPPEVAFVLPLVSNTSEMDRNGNSRQSSTESLRIYLKRPWHVTGEGEMLAFVFDQNWRNSNNRNTTEVPSPAMAWGEDPMYRTYSSETKDNISPGKLAEMFSYYENTTQIDNGYPIITQTEIRGDQVEFPGSGDEEDERRDVDTTKANIVAVQPEFDAQRKLWFVELDPGGRHLWFRFKLHRYQIHSLPGYELSQESTYTNIFSSKAGVLTIVRNPNNSEVIFDTIPYSGSIKTGGDMPELKDRYEIRELKEVAEHVYVYPNNRTEVSSVSVDDPGNARYIWKLPRGNSAKYSIWDNFSQKDVALVDLDDLHD